VSRREAEGRQPGVARDPRQRPGSGGVPGAEGRLMPLVNNKVGDDVTGGTDKAVADEQALVDSLMKVRWETGLFTWLYIL